MDMIRVSCLALLLALSSQAALIVNSPQSITQTVYVQPVVVSDTNGTNTATFLGNATQMAAILGLVDQIWAQAGIDVEWLSATAYNNTFANIGSATTTTARPTSDLPTIVNNGDAAGVANSSSTTIAMYFVRAAAGFPVLSLNSAAGLAYVDGNGITMYVGSNLLTFQAGLEAIASVIAHEIGHNLGLDHLVEAENLMQQGGSPDQGERLNAAQITIALNSPLSVAVPEPGTYLLVSVGLPLLWWQRRRAA
jgi:hypothetical protein